MISEANRHFTLTYDNGLVTGLVRAVCGVRARRRAVRGRREEGAGAGFAALALDTPVPQLLNSSRP